MNAIHHDNESGMRPTMIMIFTDIKTVWRDLYLTTMRLAFLNLQKGTHDGSRSGLPYYTETIPY